jgi:hypothetical protein
VQSRGNIGARLMLQKAWRTIRVQIILLFISFHTLALIIWTSPVFPLHDSIFVPLIRPYVCYFGFWNQWLMFSHPKTFTIYLTANVTTADGKVVRWNFPRMEKLNWITRSVQCRYRQWAHDYVNEDDYPSVRIDACKYIARQTANATSSPIRVELVRHWIWIQPPLGFGKPQPTGEFEHAFFSYDVQEGDLK